MQAITLSQQGSKSDKNEDACLSFPSKGFFVLADGVGGGPNGDFASRTVVETLYSELSGIPLSEAAILAAISKANESVFNTAQANEWRGMATTLTASWISNNQIRCFNVGDSRVYKMSAGRMSQLTRDHTKQVQKSANVIKQVVTNAIGIKSAVNVEVTTDDIQSGDVVLLATDGITDLLDEAFLLEVLTAAKLSWAEKAQAIVSESESRGGRDDKSIILAMVG